MVRYLFYLLLLVPGFASAGWQQIAKIPQAVGCCFFLNDRVGFAGTGTYSQPTTLQIFMTFDGGYSWFPASVPTGSGQVTQISIGTDGIGYASIFSQTTPGMNLWKTTDGGSSWFDNSSGARYGTGVGVTSLNYGYAFWAAGGGGTNGVFFMDSATMTITPGPGSAQAEAWSAYGDPIDRIWYRVAELSSALVWLNPVTNSWVTRFDFSTLIGNNRKPTGHIHGKYGVMYIQTEAAGMLRTTSQDSGRSWRVVSGPSNNIDTRSFWVMGCKGETVIAFDATGGVWKTTDGGDGSLSVNSPIVWESITFPPISACTSATRSAKLMNTQCGMMVLTSVSFENNPGVFIFTPPQLPDTLAEGMSYSTHVDLVPNGNYGNFNGQIRIKGFVEAGGNKRNFDSVIKVSASVNGENPRLTLNVSTLDLGSAGICGGKTDSVFIFKNTGCDTLEIVSGPGALAPEFTIDNITLPYALPPDSSVTIGAHFIPITLGAKSTFANYTGRMHGKTQDISFDLKGVGTDGVGVLSYEPKSFDFDTISICSSSDSLFGFLTNDGCVPITIENFALSGVSDYVLLGANPNGSVLQPNDTVRYGIRFSPQLKGSKTGSIAIRSKNTSGTGTSKDYTVGITGFVGDGTKAIASTPNGGTVDLGTVFLCDETSTTVQIRNSGCDTIVLSTATLIGTGFTVDVSQLPKVLAPGENITLVVNTIVDTTGGKTQNLATLLFTSQSGNSLSPITYIRTISFPGNASFGIAPVPHPSNPKGTAGDPVRFALIESPSENFINANIRSIEFDLGYNSDLITYTGSQGANTLTTSDNRHFTLSGSPYIQADASGKLAELDFRIYLTRDSVTDITISNVSIGTGTQDPCATSVTTTSGASFTYTYECADHMIQDFMQGENLQLSAIKPNPASSEITFIVKAPIKETLELTVVGLNGVTQLKRSKSVLSGENLLTVPIHSLPEGSYILTVASQTGSVSRQFIRVK
jgi:hypothetical protein